MRGGGGGGESCMRRSINVPESVRRQCESSLLSQLKYYFSENWVGHSYLVAVTGSTWQLQCLCGSVRVYVALPGKVPSTPQLPHCHWLRITGLQPERCPGVLWTIYCWFSTPLYPYFLCVMQWDEKKLDTQFISNLYFGHPIDATANTVFLRRGCAFPRKRWKS